MKQNIVLAFIVFLAIAVSAQESTETSPQYAGYVQTAYYIQQGQNWQTWLSIPEGYSGEFLLSNQQPAMDFLLTCMLDYRQVPCIWDGEDTELYAVSLDGGETIRIPMITPPLSDDFHDFIVIAFGNPFSEDLTDDYRIRTDLNYLYRSRLLFVPEAFEEGMPYVAAVAEEDWIRGEAENLYLEGVIQNQEPNADELRAWTVVEAEAGEWIDYNLQIGSHPDGVGSRLAIMAFLDYRQITFDGEDQWVIYADLEAGTAATVPVRLQAPLESGIHELLIVHTYDPFAMLEVPALGEDRQATEIIEGTYSGIRTAIVVR
jgi:hypothetical protein